MPTPLLAAFCDGLWTKVVNVTTLVLAVLVCLFLRRSFCDALKEGQGIGKDINPSLLNKRDPVSLKNSCEFMRIAIS
ncbi:MAG TPA: hypothetical protein VFN35_36485 [Ktedonobacteraceae bacterium]|nr:hypothetical protein [Ktedonobacteraceae bacterium]